jgi:predicted SnoaL-like aldol condensation-catalyzing enzyme
LSKKSERNKALVLEAMTSLFQRKDPLAVERLYAPGYIQHNPGIAQGREALAKLVARLPCALFYEPGLMIAEGDFVAIHGRIRGWAPRPQIVIDIFRIEDGRLAEHWDVLQDEIETDGTKSGTAMFSPGEAALTCASVDYDGLMGANLVNVFGERDAARRMKAIRELYAEDAILLEPQASAKGHDAISDAVAALHLQLPPHFQFQAVRPAVGHHGTGRLQWRGGPPDGPAVITGTDVAHFEDGLITSLHVFLDTAGA